MPVDLDPDAKFAAYAHPERLVSTDWLREHLGDAGLTVLESDEDVLLYESGHIPGAVKIDWHTELNDQVQRDFIDSAAFASVLGAKGVSRDSTVVIYGDKNNWWAAYALWVFSLFGHPDVRLLDGGRDKWIAEGGALTREATEVSPTEYPVVPRQDAPIRAFKQDVLAHFGRPLIDVRSLEEYTGERTTMPAYPEEGALRGGHIPSAVSVPWARAAAAVSKTCATTTGPGPSGATPSGFRSSPVPRRARPPSRVDPGKDSTDDCSGTACETGRDPGGLPRARAEGPPAPPARVRR
jgi:thiosulfate/3-mercaptopyruvate sulfurtransferase